MKTPRSIIIIFLLFLVLPVIGQAFKLDPYSPHTENRKLGAMPGLSWSLSEMKEFPKLYQTYFDDNFGFRNTLVRGSYLYHAKLLRTSPSDSVILGRNGWLYYSGTGELEDYRGITHFSESQLFRYAELLNWKKAWLAEMGIRYLLIIAPNKSTIYPEHLPKGYGRVRQETGLDELIAYLRQNTDLEVIDLRDQLLQRKSERNLFKRTDTHWNNYGAFLAYREIVRPLASWFPTIKPFDFSDFTVTAEKCSSGDLAAMMGGQEFLSDENYAFVPKKPLSSVMCDKMDRPERFTMTNGIPGLPRAVIFRDSFFSAVVPFISEHFNTSRYIKSDWNEHTPIGGLITKYRPNVVIEEIVERKLKNIISKDHGAPNY